MELIYHALSSVPCFDDKDEWVIPLKFITSQVQQGGPHENNLKTGNKPIYAT